MKKEIEDEVEDREKADFVEENEFVSDREEEENTKPKEMYHGGMMGEEACSTCGAMPDEPCGMDMGFMSPSVGIDEVSGNPIPPGSNAENVRDDIPAALSSGEYVVPADVVRYHGLKTFMALRDEAKLGLMSMQFEGQIANIQEEMTDKILCPECDGEGCEHCNFTGYHTEEEIETPEGNKVEKAKVETKEEKMEEDDEYPSKKYSYKPRMTVALIK